VDIEPSSKLHDFSIDDEALLF